MVLEAIYEQEFLDCSYGFRPNRSAHQALDALWKTLTEMNGGWVLEVDIKGFFDSLDHGHLRGFLDQRVRDGVLRRAIDKWLKAGVMEAGVLTHPDTGTPQGGVVSPLLANVYLHEVLDRWFETQVRPRLVGRATLIRYADDFVIAFSSEVDARRVSEVLPKRFGKYGLTLHSGEDAVGEVSPTVVAGRGQARCAAWDLRPARLHALLGQVASRLHGVEAPDRQGSSSPSVKAGGAAVSGESAPVGRRAATQPEPQAAGALRLLRHHR